MYQPLKQLTQLSRAAKLASLCCALLILLTLLAWIIFQLDPARVAWSDYMTLGRAVMLGLLLTITTASLYFSARLWLDETPASADEVESAWQAGITAFSKVGISIADLPVFLFLGATTTEQQRQLMNAGNLKLIVDGPAQANAPLNWFATNEAIYLFCGSAGVLGRTIDNLRKASSLSIAGDVEVGLVTSTPLGDLSLGMAIEEPARLSPALQAADLNRENSATVARNEQSLACSEHGPTATLVRPRLAKPSLKVEAERQLHNIESMLEEQLQLDRLGIHDREGISVGPPLCEASLTSLTSTETADGQHMLTDVCARLRGRRRPVAPINGIGIIVDMAAVISSELAARQCGDAIRGELEQVRSQLGQQAPVSIVCTGMEIQPGVSEVIRRLGAATAGSLTIGQLCDPREVTNSPMIERCAEQALGTIEKLVLHLLRSPESMSMPGSNQLIRLLIASRQRFIKPLKILLNQALLQTPVTHRSQAGFFNGLFFAAIGIRPIERAFAAPLLQRLHAQQHWLAWTDAELKMQRRERFLNGSLAVLCAVELLALIVQAVS